MAVSHECRHDRSCHRAPECYANLSHPTQSGSLFSYGFTSCCEKPQSGAKVKSVVEKVVSFDNGSMFSKNADATKHPGRRWKVTLVQHGNVLAI